MHRVQRTGTPPGREKIATMPFPEAVFPANDPRSIARFWFRYWLWFFALLPWMLVRQIAVSAYQLLGALATWNRRVTLVERELELQHMTSLGSLVATPVADGPAGAGSRESDAAAWRTALHSGRPLASALLGWSLQGPRLEIPGVAVRLGEPASAESAVRVGQLFAGNHSGILRRRGRAQYCTLRKDHWNMTVHQLIETRFEWLEGLDPRPEAAFDTSWNRGRWSRTMAVGPLVAT